MRLCGDPTSRGVDTPTTPPRPLFPCKHPGLSCRRPGRLAWHGSLPGSAPALSSDRNSSRGPCAESPRATLIYLLYTPLGRTPAAAAPAAAAKHQRPPQQLQLNLQQAALATAATTAMLQFRGLACNCRGGAGGRACRTSQQLSAAPSASASVRPLLPSSAKAVQHTPKASPRPMRGGAAAVASLETSAPAPASRRQREGAAAIGRGGGGGGMSHVAAPLAGWPQNAGLPAGGEATCSTCARAPPAPRSSSTPSSTASAARAPEATCRRWAAHASARASN
eukprot:358554-Chlamydomonas_euryale.AAC.3